ncbi:hypothetical protein [Algivirga pacifica]|uniref:Outer membrane protein beta-barrel domain-containing protein n=1 Tax=Algivirga pacifica TaxID=1162670 RepID=A0ABP9DN41_9BACT
MKRLSTLLLTILLTAPLWSSAQYSTLSLELGTGPQSYRGDLNPSFGQWGYHISGGIRITPKEKRLHFYTGVTYGKVMAQSYSYETPDPNYTPLTQVDTRIFSVESKLFVNLIKKTSFRLYLQQGIALNTMQSYTPIKDPDTGIVINTPVENQIQSIETSNIITYNELNYSPFFISFPTGIGASYHFKNAFGIALESTLMNPISDYLDVMSELGNPKNLDNVWQFRCSVLVPLRTIR